MINLLRTKTFAARCTESTTCLRRSTVTAALAGLALMLMLSTAAHACPLCADAIQSEQGADSAGVTRGFFWSILFLMGMPFLLFGGFTTLLVRAVRRQQAEEREEAFQSSAMR